MHMMNLLDAGAAAACLVLASAASASEYSLGRSGNEMEAFADGRRFAVLSPAESGDWKFKECFFNKSVNYTCFTYS